MKKLYKTLGDALKFHRKKMYLSREDVAKLLNVTPSLVAKWETNERSPRDRIHELCKYYRVSFEELLMSCKYSKKALRTQEETLMIIHKRCFVFCMIIVGFVVFLLTSLITTHLYNQDLLSNEIIMNDPISLSSITHKSYFIKWNHLYMLLLSMVLFILNLIIETVVVIKKRKLTEENLERMKE